MLVNWKITAEPLKIKLERFFKSVLKVWIQRNMTETDIAAEFVAMGIAKEDIVLGLHPPYKRPYTGYGVASLECSR